MCYGEKSIIIISFTRKSRTALFHSTNINIKDGYESNSNLIVMKKCKHGYPPTGKDRQGNGGTETVIVFLRS